jgi:hypothetical protein
LPCFIFIFGWRGLANVSRSRLINHGSSICYSRCAGRWGKVSRLMWCNVKDIIKDSVLSASSECLLVPYIHFGSYRCVWNTLTCRKNFIILSLFTFECCDAAIATVGENFRSKILSWAGPLARPPGTRKTPFLGLPKSRPSPLQKCAKNGVFGRKSVHFRSICAQFCTKMTSFLRT